MERCGNVLLHHSRKGLRHSGMSARDSSMGMVSWVCYLILATAAKVFLLCECVIFMFTMLYSKSSMTNKGNETISYTQKAIDNPPVQWNIRIFKCIYAHIPLG